jgi:hypothetical protein
MCTCLDGSDSSLLRKAEIEFLLDVVGLIVFQAGVDTVDPQRVEHNGVGSVDKIVTSKEGDRLGVVGLAAGHGRDFQIVEFLLPVVGCKRGE